MKKQKISIPHARDWRTTDDDERNRRRIRALEEKFTIRNMYSSPGRAVFSNFSVSSKSGLRYSVEIRGIMECKHSCTCVDFRKIGLGTCKHIEAVLLYLKKSKPRIFKHAAEQGSDLADIVVDSENDTLRIERGYKKVPASLRKHFGPDAVLLPQSDPHEVIEALRKLQKGNIRISQDVSLWLQRRKNCEERILLRRQYEQKVLQGEFPLHETTVPLFPYQRQGMLHLAFTERALLADEMGLGKTIQAIAACALLNRLGVARRVLVVTPASLKTEWEEQIRKFTTLPLQIVYGSKKTRLLCYRNAPFFTIANYEQIRADGLDINQVLKADIVVLDEAQRIKNWNTGTAQAVKRLQSRYAFVLTGTPLENRIDELYSIIEFLDPTIFGPLFRFNREFYQLDDKGRPADYKNLDKLHEKIKPVMLRRRKSDVETELPGRDISNRFVSMNTAQKKRYEEHSSNVAQLLATLKRRPLTPKEQDMLMRQLAMMRMVCDTVYILDPKDRSSPKIDELEQIISDIMGEQDKKVVIFSEWVRMLELIRDVCKRKKIGFAWHTGSVPQQTRRKEINRFKEDSACRVFLSTESGGVGLNLQNASFVINCDLPWNPARLEQRIARVWRKNQKNAVTVINLVAENTIEYRMLFTLQSKQGLADGVLDNIGDLSKISLKSGAQAFYKQLEQVMSSPSEQKPIDSTPISADHSAAFSRKLHEKLPQHVIVCEEHFPLDASPSTLLVVVEHKDDEKNDLIRSMYKEMLLTNDSSTICSAHLNILDKSTYEALQVLQKQGVIQQTVRAIRNLSTVTANTISHSEEERMHMDSFCAIAKRKLKASQALLSADLHEESRSACLEALFAYGQARAVLHKLPLPQCVEDVIMHPWTPLWNGSLKQIQTFLESSQLPPNEIFGVFHFDSFLHNESIAQ